MNPKTTTEKLDFNQVAEQLAPKMEGILDFFGIEFQKSGNRIILPCPIHGSGKDNSLNIFLSGEKRGGNFVCWTKHCEQEIGNNVLFLVRYLLEQHTNKKVNIPATLHFLESNFELQKSVAEAKGEYDYFLESDDDDEEQSYQLSRDSIRRDLKIPSIYFLRRGFKQETLNYFDVGTCFKKNYQMYGRSVVPVYNLDGTGFVGCVGRSQYEKCPICNYYHSDNIQCPNNAAQNLIFHKWINSKGFRAGNHLYNSWNVREHVSNTDSVVLVEGQGDVWRLHEADVRCGLGVFGDKLTKRQFNILNKLGVQNVYLAFDNDAAGQKCTERVTEALNGYFNTFQIDFPKKDIGEHSSEELRNIFHDYRDCWK